MGFCLQCMVTLCHGDSEAAPILAAAAEHFRWTRQRHFHTPFEGVIVAQGSEQFWQYECNPTAFPFTSVDDAMCSLMFGIEDALPAFSRRFPDRLFAFVDLDCFGGVCLSGGHLLKAGEVVFRLDKSVEGGHVQLFAELGVEEPEWEFEPFTRGYFDAVGST